MKFSIPLILVTCGMISCWHSESDLKKMQVKIVPTRFAYYGGPINVNVEIKNGSFHNYDVIGGDGYVEDIDGRQYPIIWNAGAKFTSRSSVETEYVSIASADNNHNILNPTAWPIYKSINSPDQIHLNITYACYGHNDGDSSWNRVGEPAQN